MKRSSKFLFVIVLLLGVGFAIVSTSLYVSGNIGITSNDSDFDIKFTKSILDGVDVSDSTISSDGKLINFSTNDLSLVGDKSKLDFVVANNSSMYDAEVKVSCKSNGLKKDYYNVVENVPDSVLSKTSENGFIEVELLKASVDDIREEFSCTLSASAVERNSIVKSGSFATDSWDEIYDNVRNGKASSYRVGDTKSVNIDNFGVHTLRIANTSECINGEESESACGFVIEFADVLEQRVMNSSYTSVGGWPASELRNYMNTTIYNALPTDLKSVIATTKVVTGHDNTSGANNFVSNDKLYLFSPKEIWNGGTNCDTSEGVTKQLDYYKNLGINTVFYNGITKMYNGSMSTWWLATPYSKGNISFFYVGGTGVWNYDGARNEKGVSPAFRIN